MIFEISQKVRHAVVEEFLSLGDQRCHFCHHPPADIGHSYVRLGLLGEMANMELVLVSGFLLIALAAATAERRASHLSKRVALLSRVDAKLDLLLQHAGLTYDPYRDLPPEVADAVRQGRKIQAIKHYRNATGVSLKEAKEFIEQVQSRAGV